MLVAFTALVVWIPISIVFFAFARPVRALTLTVLGGWLLLPAARIPIEGFLDVDKHFVISVGAVCGAALYRSAAFTGLRLAVPDVCFVLFCASRVIASVSNGLGVYDGLSWATHGFITFGVPYVLARIFIRTRKDVHEVAGMIVLAAALYAIPAVWEWRMSPHLHINVYGFLHRSWRQMIRWGSWRPIVFFPHPLALGLFFMWTTIVAAALHRAGQRKTILGLPFGGLVALTTVGLATSMSLGPWTLCIIGLAFLLLPWSHRMRRWVVILPVVAASSWIAIRYTGLTDGRWLASAIAPVSRDRADSLLYRMSADDQLIERARLRPVFGWGGWGRNRIRNEVGEDLVYTDSLWILVFGGTGLLGLASFFLWWCWPVIHGVAHPHDCMHDPVFVACLLAIGLEAVNLLFNGFMSPMFILVLGGTVTVLKASPATSGQRARRIMSSRREGAADVPARPVDLTAACSDRCILHAWRILTVGDRAEGTPS